MSQERKQINPSVSFEVYSYLKREKEERKCSEGQLIDEMYESYMSRNAESREVIFERFEDQPVIVNPPMSPMLRAHGEGVIGVLVRPDPYAYRQISQEFSNLPMIQDVPPQPSRGFWTRLLRRIRHVFP